MRYAILARWAAIAAAALLSGQVWAAHGIPFDPETKVGRLPNGLTYYLRRFPNPERKIELRLVVKVGWVHEDPDQLGLAHLLEHLAFNGTEHYPGDSLREYLRKMGVQPGTGWNATTSGLSTDYRLSIDADRPVLYESGFQILRDWAQGLTLDQQAMDEERGVVLGEFRGYGEEVELNTRLESRIFNPRVPADFAARHERHIQTAPREPLVRFYRDWYRPDLEAVIVVGDIDLDAAEQKIAALFTDLRMPERRRRPEDAAARYSAPLPHQNQVVTLTGKTLEKPELRLYMKASAATSAGPAKVTVADYRQAIVDELFNRMIQGRFASEVNADRYDALDAKISISLNRTFTSYTPTDALMTTVVVDQPAALEQGFKAAFQELQRLKRYGFSGAELTAAREALAKEESSRHASALTSAQALADACIDHFVRGAAVPSPEFENGLNAQLLQKISMEEVNTLARNRVRTDKDFDIVLLTPMKYKGKLPSRRQWYAWMDAVERSAIAQYVYAEPKAAPAQLMSEDEVSRLDSATVAETQSLEEIAATRLTLSNGVQVVLKPTPGAGNQIDIEGFRPGGLSGYSQALRPSAAALARIATNSGAGGYDKFQLEALRKSRGISASAALNERAATLRGAGPVLELESILQLMYLYANFPRKEPAAFEDWKRREAKDRRRYDASMGFYQVARQMRLDIDARQARLTLAQIQAVDLDKVQEIYRDRLSKSGDFTFVVTGDFDPVRATPLLVKYLGALSPERSTMGTDAQRSDFPKLGSLERTIHEPNAISALVLQYMTGTFADTLINRTQLELLGIALNARIYNRLREEEGGTYDPRSELQLFKACGPDNTGAYTFAVIFEAAPQDLERLEAAAKEEVVRLRDQGLDTALFDSAVALWKKDHANLKPGFWQSYLIDAFMRGTDPTEILKRQSIVTDILTPELLSAAARRYLRLDNVMTFVRMPEEHRGKHDH